jgi:selenocysteine-specific translation elongation factor
MPNGTFVYLDMAFSVKGVGTVALGFVLSGTVSLHDRLRTLPFPEGITVQVRGIQVSDQDFERVGSGIRVGLLLKGVEPSQLGKTSWLDDWSLEKSTELELAFPLSPFYRQDVDGRDMHLHVAGETLKANFSKRDGNLHALLRYEVPVWQGMRAAVIDLNGRGLRVAGGGPCNV